MINSYSVSGIIKQKKKGGEKRITNKNLGTIDRIFRVALGFILIWASVSVFKNDFGRIVIALLGLGSILEGLNGFCYLYHYLGARSEKDPIDIGKILLVSVFMIQAVIGYEWFAAGYEKISSKTFVTQMPGTVAYFASKNPFPWYRDFLSGMDKQRAQDFGYVVQWSQILMGIVLILGSAVYLWTKNDDAKKLLTGMIVVALIGGLVMNANFYLAASWTSPGTKGVNVTMFWTQFILLYVLAWLENRRHA